MKKLGIYSLATLGMLMMVSCSHDEVAFSGGDSVVFTVKLPHELSTRGSFGDGTGTGDRAVLDRLQWTVYQVGENNETSYLFDGEWKTQAWMPPKTKVCLTP